MCDKESCNSVGKYWICQPTVPQLLKGYGMETAPATRNSISCGKHLAFFVNQLDALTFKTDQPMTIRLRW